MKTEFRNVLFKDINLPHKIGMQTTSQEWYDEHLKRFLAIVTLISFLCILVFFELLFGASVYIEFMLLYCSLGILVILLFTISVSKKFCISVIAIFLMFTLIIHVVGWGPRNTFIKKIFSVKNGTTVEQALEKMQKYKDIESLQDLNNSKIIFNNLNKSTFSGRIVYGEEFNEHGVIEFRNGKVTRVYFEYD